MLPGGLLIISSAQGFGGSRHHRHGVHRDALVGFVEREDADLSGPTGALWWIIQGPDMGRLCVHTQRYKLIYIYIYNIQIHMCVCISTS